MEYEKYYMKHINSNTKFIKYIKNNRLHIKIGKLILSKFIKTNEQLQTQQVWTSDISRLIYLILQITNGKKGWIRDKKGEIFTELIIGPMIEKINEIMLNYAKHCLKLFDKNKDSDEKMILLDNAQIAKDSTHKSYNDYVNKETLKFMASKFSMAAKKDEIYEVCF